MPNQFYLAFINTEATLSKYLLQEKERKKGGENHT